MNIHFLDFTNLFHISACVFIGSGLISLCFLKIFGDKKFRFSLALGHSLMIFYITGIAYLGRNEAQTGLIWLIPARFDFAVSWLFRMSRAVSYFGDSIIVWPTLFFLVLGGGQYYISGILLDLIWKRLKKTKNQV